MMVAKKSEYQNQFKSSVVKKHHEIYMANLALRHERRDREFMHTPLCWTEESPEDDAISSDNSEEDVHQPCESRKTETQDKEVYQSLAEIMSEAKEKADALRRQRLHENYKPAEAVRKDVSCLEIDHDFNKSAEEKEVADKSLSIYDIVDKENRKLNQKIAQAYVFDKKKEGKCVEVSDTEEKDLDIKKGEIFDITKESNLRKTYVKKHTAKKSCAQPGKSKTPVQERSSKSKGAAQVQPVPSSSVPSLSLTSLASQRPVRPDRRSKRRPVSACSMSKHPKPPFLAYGAADVEDSLALHRTHNVLAPRDVSNIF
ncbi:hypothetical protein ElyMa_001722600 [Elysia marginata]|uniref:Uncharacterized protein n=1 Tax=Elysia marginata TaxID=1093978 RepID=A0AAV4JWB3_9GAST|nr:hypothetical protein ElyMa_001722600 [Elysia marginata]